MANVIHRTSTLRRNVKEQLGHYAKFFLGRRVKIGKEYAGYQVLNGISVSKASCVPCYYDEALRKLLVRASDKPDSIIFLEGDAVVWKNVILVDHGGSSIHFEHSPQYAIKELITQLPSQEPLTEEIVFAALRGKYNKYPPSYLRSIARWYFHNQR